MAPNEREPTEESSVPNFLGREQEAGSDHTGGDRDTTMKVEPGQSATAQDLSGRGRTGPRSWPPKAHKFPITFNLGKETTGILKSVKVELLPYYHEILTAQDEKRTKGEFHWASEHVREFNLSFYIPLDVMNIPEQRIRNVLIMVNGLNEIDYIHYAHHDRIGAYLAPREIGAILHPTPFHLNRTAYLDTEFWVDYERHSREHFPDYREALQARPQTPGTIMGRLPHHSMLRRPKSIFYCFEQTAKELISLAAFLREVDDGLFDDSDKKFYDRFFARGEGLRVSVCGYSLGGLQALYAFLQRPDLFHRCILINSGASVNKLRTKPVRISDQHWKSIVSKTVGTKIPDDIENWGLLHDILFNRPFQQEAAVTVFQKNVGNLLFIAGGADIVSPNEYLAQFVDTREIVSTRDAEAFAGLNILQIAGLEHPLQRSPVYDQWFPVIMEVVRNFLRDPEHEPASYDELIAALMEIRIEGQPWDRWVSEPNTDPPYIDPRDQNLEVERFLNRIPAENTEGFLKYYMISKRYFENDRDLVSAIERERQRRTQATSPAPTPPQVATI